MACEVHITEAGRQLGVGAQHLRQLERLERIPTARRDQFGARIYSDFDISLLKALGVGRRPRRLLRLDEVLEADQ
jgi:DNA-binding transcriptional MerR regulator